MKIKKFKARTFAEALDLVKKELSEDAVILSSEEIRGLRPAVEVTAAVDYDREAPEPAPGQAEGMGRDARGTGKGEPDERGEESPAASAEITPHAARRAPDDGPVGEIRSEIESLRKAIDSMKNSGYEMTLPREKRAAFAFLRERAVRDEYALRLCENVKTLDDIPLLISSDIRVKSRQPSKKAVMFIGPTGVGKTTTIAKLAAQAVKAGKKTAIINLDTYRIGAVEQVRIYSRILGIPLAVAASAAELRSGLLKFSETRDAVFIDTTGRNPLDERFIGDMAGLCAADVPLEIHLLMSANSDDAFMIEAYKYYRRLPVDYIAFSKVDEAVRYGPLYNLILTYQKPVSYLTTGQRVPGDIEPATVNRLAGLIVQRREC